MKNPYLDKIKKDARASTRTDLIIGGVILALTIGCTLYLTFAISHCANNGGFEVIGEAVGEAARGFDRACKKDGVK